MAIQKARPAGGQGWDHEATPLTGKKRKREDSVTLAAAECMQPNKGKDPESLEDRAELSPRDPGTAKLFSQRAYRMPKP